MHPPQVVSLLKWMITEIWFIFYNKLTRIQGSRKAGLNSYLTLLSPEQFDVWGHFHAPYCPMTVLLLLNCYLVISGDRKTVQFDVWGLFHAPYCPMTLLLLLKLSQCLMMVVGQLLRIGVRKRIQLEEVCPFINNHDEYLDLPYKYIETWFSLHKTRGTL